MKGTFTVWVSGLFKHSVGKDHYCVSRKCSETSPWRILEVKITWTYLSLQWKGNKQINIPVSFVFQDLCCWIGISSHFRACIAGTKNFSGPTCTLQISRSLWLVPYLILWSALSWPATDGYTFFAVGFSYIEFTVQNIKGCLLFP